MPKQNEDLGKILALDTWTANEKCVLPELSSCPESRSALVVEERVNK